MSRMGSTSVLIASASAVVLSACTAAGGTQATSLTAASASGLSSSLVQVIGNGTAASCTSQAVVRAVAAGGSISFSCGPKPVTITMQATAKVVNTSPLVVINGGGKVTLSGGGVRRILYMNTCDKKQIWTTYHCQHQTTPQLTVKNLTFTDGNSTGQTYDGGGGGAIFTQGGRFTVVNSRFTGNRCDGVGPDLGGAAIRALSDNQGLTVSIINSTFTGGRCSNGGALSGLGVSWFIHNCQFIGNDATGYGANPAKKGTPGGGSGGAIYTDGNDYTITLGDSVIRNNLAHEGGGAIFYVSNNHTGTLHITDTIMHSNPSLGFETIGFPGIFYHGAGKGPTVINSSLK